MSDMKNLKINFVDFWDSFHKKDNYFYHLLSQEFNVIIDAKDPDLVIGSRFGSNIFDYKNHRSVKVYYTGENDDARDPSYDFYITQHRTNEANHFRLPLWAFFTSWFDECPLVHSRDPSFLIPWKSLDKNKIDLEAVYDAKKSFCSYIYADITKERRYWLDFFNSIRSVDSAGSSLNNTGGRLPGRGDQVYKIAFMSDYFFSLSIENSGIDGYATEKILHPMSACVIPAYWGDTNVQEDINVDSIIDLRRSESEILEEIRELLASKKSYLQKLEKSWFVRDHSTMFMKECLEFFKRSLSQSQRKIVS